MFIRFKSVRKHSDHFEERPTFHFRNNCYQCFSRIAPRYIFHKNYKHHNRNCKRLFSFGQLPNLTYPYAPKLQWQNVFSKDHTTTFFMTRNPIRFTIQKHIAIQMEEISHRMHLATRYLFTINEIYARLLSKRRRNKRATNINIGFINLFI